jgi:hypothetical protein
VFGTEVEFSDEFILQVAPILGSQPSSSEWGVDSGVQDAPT